MKVPRTAFKERCPSLPTFLEANPTDSQFKLFWYNIDNDHKTRFEQTLKEVGVVSFQPEKEEENKDP